MAWCEYAIPQNFAEENFAVSFKVKDFAVEILRFC